MEDHNKHDHVLGDTVDFQSAKRKVSSEPIYPCKKTDRRKSEEKSCSNEETVEEVMEDMEEEIDNALEQRSSENKLTTANVKHILRHIIANEYVLAMVRSTMKSSNNTEDETGEIAFEPKLTRSKAKEMRNKQYKLPWPVSSPAKKIDAAAKKLLEEEFPDESSSDEDYNPVEEEPPSEEDEPMSSPKSGGSKISPTSSPIKSTDIEPQSDDENKLVIELPESDIPAGISEADKIALRTRSKLCLNNTLLEDIEASFIAPDITVDMYDTHCDDEAWKEFLMELSRPIGSLSVSEHPGEEAEEDDPEYKAPEEEILDYKELRYDSDVKVTRDELNALMAEILEYAQQDLSFLDDDEHRMIIETQIPPVTPECIQNVAVQWMSADEKLQLQEQMRMHVQLLTQSYLLSLGNSDLKYINVTSKILLDEMKMFAYREMLTGERSAFYAENLDGSLEIIQKFENMPVPKSAATVLKKLTYPVIPQHVRETIAKSKVFIYPELLPACGFRQTTEKRKTVFSVSEDNLIALGMEQFEGMKDSLYYIHSLLVPTKKIGQIKVRIKNCASKKCPISNPIKFYHVHKKAPEYQRFVRTFDSDNVKDPADYPPEILPKWMSMYTKSKQTVLAPAKKSLLTPKTPIQLLRKGTESRKLLPILPRMHSHSPLKQISPILKKYSQQRRIVPATPVRIKLFNKTSQEPITVETDASVQGYAYEEGSGSSPRISNLVVGADQMKPQTTHALSLSEKLSLFSSVVKESPPPSPTNMDSFTHNEVLEEPSNIGKEGVEEAVEDEPPAVVVKKHSISKKKNKLQKDKEASLALLQPKLMANDPKKEERETLFANSYLLRATETLKADPEVYDAFIKTLCHHYQSSRSPVELFKELQDVLKDYPSLVRDFIAFLNAEQAKECGHYKDHIIFSKIREFFRKVEIHLKNQPQQLSRVVKALCHLHRQAELTSTEVVTALQPLLRNQTHLMEELYTLLPDAAPPQYLMTDFEELKLPNSDAEETSSVDSCEEIIIPDDGPDPCGGKDCPCQCHVSATDHRLITKMHHCIKCGVKFMDGKIYIQTGKVLKPAQVTYLETPPPPQEKHVTEPHSKTSATDAHHKHTDSKTEVSKKDSKITNQVSSASEITVPNSSSEVILYPQKTQNDIESREEQASSSQAISQNVKWTSDEDKLILYNCQRYGLSKKAILASSTAIGCKTAEQVEERLLHLMKLISKEIKISE